MKEHVGVYPQYSFRGNAFASVYSKIAIDHFIKAQQEFVERCKDEDSFLCEPSDLCENIIVCQTFSAFAIEAYLNDFISATLLDEDYKSFDRLSCISKLELISVCLFHERLSSSDVVYCKIKELFRDRDNIAHNKSYDFSKISDGMTQGQYEEYEEWKASHPEDPDEMIKQTIQSTKEYEIELLSEGYDALRAMVLLVEYFLANGEDKRAAFRMFSRCYSQIISLDPEHWIDSSSPYYDLFTKLKMPSPNSYRRQYIN